jgi:hypothetical protein
MPYDGDAIAGRNTRQRPGTPTLGVTGRAARSRRARSDPSRRTTHVRALTAIVMLSAAILALGGPAVAQEGHPLKGSWNGTWGPAKTHSNDLLMVLNWDGKAITGTINPGTDNMQIKHATLTPEGWVVRMEADGKDASGAPLNYTIEGKIENIALHNRTITGTWKNQRESGAFKLQRQ